MPRARTAVLVLLALGLIVPGALAKPSSEIVEEEDGQYVRLYLKDDPAAQAWLYRPMLTEDELPEPAEDPSEVPVVEIRPADLIVALHGAGGIPKNFILPTLMEERGAWCLAVAGRRARPNDDGVGYVWDGNNVPYIVAFVEYLLAKHPILNKDRVIVWGHSQGGGVTLATLAAAPKLFAGGLTTAAPATPDSSHQDLRTCAFLGTEDPNWRNAAAIRSFVEKLLRKGGKGACAFFALEGLGHELPYDEYLDLGFDWVLAERTRGGEAHGGRRAKGDEGEYHHILVRHKGAEGADDVTRSRATASKLLKSIKKEVQKGRAYFPFEAACHSEDEDSSSGGGALDADDLEAFVGEIPELRPGEISRILPSPQGLHLIYRP